MLAGAAVQFTSLGIVALVLVAVGQPIWTDDLWWHLALGRAFANLGALLSSDPLLFGAVGPPLPVSWLADVFFFEVERTLGFTGLRGLHVALVLLILGLCWWLLRRAAGQAWAASLGTAIFAAICAYRLVQMRPHLFTILAVLLLYALAFAGRRPLSKGRIVGVAALLGMEEGIDAPAETRTLLKAFSDYVEKEDLDDDASREKTDTLVDYANEQLRRGEPMTLEELSGLVDEKQPKAFYDHIRNADYGLSPEIPPDKRTISQFRRFTGRSGGVSISFDSHLLGSSIEYDETQDRLIIKQVPKQLKEQLAKRKE